MLTVSLEIVALLSVDLVLYDDSIVYSWHQNGRKPGDTGSGILTRYHLLQLLFPI